jgi:hypothetical protein
MPATYEPIETYVLANDTTDNVVFSNIPQTYSDLRIVASMAGTSRDLRIQVNSDTTAANYPYFVMSAYQSSGSSDKVTAKSVSYDGTLLDYYGTPYTDKMQHLMICDFIDYTSTSHHKAVYSKATSIKAISGSGVTNGLDHVLSLWRNNNAITSLKFWVGTSGTVYWSSGSTVTLYGIKRA